MAALTSYRRTFLLGSAGTFALFAGCVADPDDGSDSGAGTDDSAGSNGSDENESSGDDTDSENDDTTDSTADDTDESTGTVTYETNRYHYPESSTEPDATLLVDRGDATDWLAARGLEADPLGAFVDDTPFTDATLIALEAAAPNACYEMGLEEIGVPNGTTDGGDALELEATVRDESDETEACTQALTTVGVLVRAAVDAEPVTEISAEIVDERDDEHEISAGVDTATSASE